MNENIKKINNISLNTPPQSFIDRVQAFIDDYRFQVDELIKKDYMKQFGREPMLNLSNDIFQKFQGTRGLALLNNPLRDMTVKSMSK